MALRALRRASSSLAALGAVSAPASSELSGAILGALNCDFLKKSFKTSAPARAPIAVEDEVYNRQRSMMPLEDRVPETSVDSWVAPSAIVVGDVDIHDKVGLSHRLRETVVYVLFSVNSASTSWTLRLPRACDNALVDIFSPDVTDHKHFALDSDNFSCSP